MRIEMKSRILCEDCGASLPIRNKWKRINDGARPGPHHGVYAMKSCTLLEECPVCHRRQRVELLLIRGYAEPAWRAYQLRRDETPEEGMRRVMAAIYEKREPEPVFVGRYWGRV